MSKSEYIEFDCLEIRQPIGIFYIGCLNCRDLIDIAYADIRTIDEERRDVETHLGIQRPLSPNRVKEIEQYVKLIDATFPTSILLAIDSENVEFSKQKSKMRILRDEKVAKILDGQHRIAGLKSFDSDPNGFQLNVTIFVDMDIDDQAMIFATINLKQTRVNKSLVYDLFDYSKSRSPQKTCHDIAKLLNNEHDSPFENKIKILGQAEDKEKETITQATFVESLIGYISKNPVKDRDLLKRGKKIENLSEKELRICFLRKLFDDKKDAEIARIIWNYFAAVRRRWPISWNENIRGNILNRSTGFISLMRYFKDVNLLFNEKNIKKSEEEYYGIFKKIKLNDSEFTPDIYIPGSSGQRKLYQDLLNLSKMEDRF